MPECYARPLPPYPGYFMRVGVRGESVRQVQTCLNSVNNAGLATDGIFGPLTQAAVINYQRVNGLVPDGIVGPITWEHLMRRCGFTPARLITQENAPEMEMIPEFPPSEGIAWDGNPPGTPLPEGFVEEWTDTGEEMPQMPPPEPEQPMFTMPTHPVMPLPLPMPEPLPEPPVEAIPMPVPVQPNEPPTMPPQISLNSTLQFDFELNPGGINLPDIDLDELLKLYLLRKMRKG
jgi:hypothetical protein